MGGEPSVTVWPVGSAEAYRVSVTCGLTLAGTYTELEAARAMGACFSDVIWDLINTDAAESLAW